MDDASDGQDSHASAEDEDPAPFNPFALLEQEVVRPAARTPAFHNTHNTQDGAPEDDESDDTPSSPPRAATTQATPSKSQRRKQKQRAKKAEAEARARADQELDELFAQHAQRAPDVDEAATNSVRTRGSHP